MAVFTSPGETELTRMLYCAHSIARVCTILRTPAFEAPYGADGTRLFGLYDAIEAVKTMDPGMFSLIKARAAARAV